MSDKTGADSKAKTTVAKKAAAKTVTAKKTATKNPAAKKTAAKKTAAAQGSPREASVAAAVPAVSGAAAGKGTAKRAVTTASTETSAPTAAPPTSADASASNGSTTTASVPAESNATAVETQSAERPSTRTRLAVRKTYKLYIGGAFPRSESGRSYEVTSAQGAFVANAALASRKDARDAVRAARSAFSGWSGATAYNRGQILYRIAEMLEGRREQFADEVSAAEGVTRDSALAQADAAIDRWVWYAGWSDKISQVRGTVNPVAGPYWNVSSPEPTGVVAVFAPERPSLFGLVSVLAPVIVSGNTAVVVAPGPTALPAITLAEVLATSDLPGGVINILTGRIAELGMPLASHLDVDALDLSGVTDPELATELERAGAQNLKRLRRPEPEPDWTADPGLDRIVSFMETKTVWHPVGV
ncbi:MAG TPA: aldehyde dehydrogenase family protein [Actinocrinis sp.]|nr:aldehyde dehydrogenase family protein [Actinocrinis sp.]HZP50042.1 aldehyde dehydrogenase family protein [Actinocrinis sp.]